MTFYIFMSALSKNIPTGVTTTPKVGTVDVLIKIKIRIAPLIYPKMLPKKSILVMIFALLQQALFQITTQELWKQYAASNYTMFDPIFFFLQRREMVRLSESSIRVTLDLFSLLLFFSAIWLRFE